MPMHDSYHHYGPLFLDDIVPRPIGRTLDLGCGEGRVARDLIAHGHHVVGIDASEMMVRAAAGMTSAPVAVSDANALPFPDASFELIVAYNVLMDLDDLEGAIVEAARVLTPHGRLAVSVLHPVAEAGRFESRSPSAEFVIRDTYFGTRPYRERFERDGLEMTFSSTAYPLEHYARVLEAAGFAIERLREPLVPIEAVADDPSEERWRRLPLFLFLRAVRHG
jgi:SAM-dependent methyltransferase